MNSRVRARFVDGGPRPHDIDDLHVSRCNLQGDYTFLIGRDEGKLRLREKDGRSSKSALGVGGESKVRL